MGMLGLRLLMRSLGGGLCPSDIGIVRSRGVTVGRRDVRRNIVSVIVMGRNARNIASAITV